MSVVGEPINLGTSSNKECGWKRKGSDGEDSDELSRVAAAAKKACLSWYVMLESESPQPTSSDDDESVYSLQNQETEYARDTSDTSDTSNASTWAALSDGTTHEYEPASEQEKQNSYIDLFSSSDPELQISKHVVGAIVAAVATGDSDVALADDSDDSMSSGDSEIGHADYWTCVQCNNNNNNPLFRYCEKCYQERKLFLPPRPKGKRGRKRSKKKWSRLGALEAADTPGLQDSGLGGSTTASFGSSVSELSRCTTTGTASLSQDSIGTSSFSHTLSQQASSSLSRSSTECRASRPDDLTNNSFVRTDSTSDENSAGGRFVSQESRESMASTVLVEDTNFDFVDTSGDDAELVGKLKISSKNAKSRSNDDNNKFCLICTVVPKNGLFVHGRDSHVCCCYRCAMRVWKTTKHCPICNRKVTDVLKVYFA